MYKYLQCRKRHLPSLKLRQISCRLPATNRTPDALDAFANSVGGWYILGFGLARQFTLKWVSLRQCWQRTMALARAVKASFYSRESSVAQFKSRLASASLRY